MSKVHVCMISYGFHSPWVEGCSVIARDLTLALRNHTDVSVISLVRTDYLGFKEKNNEKIRSVHYLKPNSIFRFARDRGKFLLVDQTFEAARIWSRLKSLNSKQSIDIVHIYNVSHLMISVLAKTFLKKATIVHVFGDASSIGEKLSKNFVDAYICTSKSNLAHLINNGLPVQNAHFVPPIINCQIYRPLVKENCRNSLNVSSASFVVTYIGNLFPERFPLDVIKEIKNITKESPNLELRLYAPHSMRNLESSVKLERLLSRSKIKHQIVISNLNEDDKVMVYNASDVLIFPFIQKISGTVAIDPPLTILEGMACGRIVIASRTLSIPEIIQNGENGFIVEPGNYESFRNTLKYVVDNFQEFQFIEANARRTIQKRFSPEIVVDKIMSIYRSIID